MSIIERPIIWLIGVLGLLAFMLVLFKVLNFFENKNVKSKGKSDKKEEKTPQKEDKQVSESKESSEKIVDDEEVKSDYFNYLYDRFVVSPTSDDKIKIKSISDAFLTQNECENIKNNKVHIEITPVKCLHDNCNEHKDIKSTIENIISENKTTKSKLLEEFDGLSREMKLLLIENIMNKKF